MRDLTNFFCNVFVSKPDGQVASRVFQHYSVHLMNALGGSAAELSTEFWSVGLISREQCEQVQLSQQTSIQKGNLLLGAIRLRFDIDGGDRTLRKLCKIMSRHKHLKKLSAKILSKYGTSCRPSLVTRAFYMLIQ